MPQILNIYVNAERIARMEKSHFGFDQFDYQINWELFCDHDNSSIEIKGKYNIGIKSQPEDLTERNKDWENNSLHMLRLLAAASLKESHGEIISEDDEKVIDSFDATLIFKSNDRYRGMITIRNSCMQMHISKEQVLTKDINIPKDKTPLQTILLILAENRDWFIAELETSV